MTIIPEPLDPGYDYHLAQRDGDWKPVELNPDATYVLIPERGRGHVLHQCTIGGPPQLTPRTWLEYVDRRTTERGPAC